MAARTLRMGRCASRNETIYLSLFVQSRGALRHELTAQLRSGRVTRRPQGRVLPSGKGQGTGKLMI